ncbi:unnamed protein product [Prorocentrum cordatum]|uniref:Uncharacterized protein n=1 Tax=Prorocentrum cordatum TaxID=2364126 RepID=A0ABN9T4I7_9DINO|nr:unnamed protein product [Polarella glacialis]
MTNSTYVCSPAWSTRAIALIFAMGVGPAGGIFNWRWLSWLAWLLHTRALGDRQEIRIDAAGMAGKFGEVPDYQVGTRALWDLLRTGIGTWFWMLMLKPVRSLVNFIMPEETSDHVRLADSDIRPWALRRMWTSGLRRTLLPRQC